MSTYMYEAATGPDPFSSCTHFHRHIAMATVDQFDYAGGSEQMQEQDQHAFTREELQDRIQAYNSQKQVC